MTFYDIDPRAGWQETVLRARAKIDEVLEESPSLRSSPVLDVMVAHQLVRQRRLVADVLALYGEAPRVPLDGISFTRDQVFGPWLPQAP